MGLGTVQARGLFLTTAGGFIWNRKADESDPNYAEQTFIRADKTEGVRKGARYADLTGDVTDVVFRTHPEYGQNINVTVESDGESYVFSISTNNKYSQDMMKCLLKMDFSKPLFIKPYDFTGTDGKRAQGLSFRQDGQKMDLKGIEGAPTKEKEWFKTASKRDIKRFFEDLNDWFVEEVEELVIPKIAALKTGDAPDQPEVEEEDNSTQEQAEGPKAEAKKEAASDKSEKASPIKMKKYLKAYIAENYDDGEVLPKTLKGEELVKWYNLALEEEELPFTEDEPQPQEESSKEVSEDELDDQLNSLMES